VWGKEGWKKVVVCIVSDGRSKINKRTLQVLALVGPHDNQLSHSGFITSPSDGMLSRGHR
jgi:hypothetical protein